MHDSFIILTDSGGIQEEAPALGKPVIVMRETTERPESLYNKRKNLVGSQKNIIVKTINNLLMDKKLYKEMAKTIFPYGKGGASIKIRKVLEKKFL